MEEPAATWARTRRGRERASKWGGVRGEAQPGAGDKGTWSSSCSGLAGQAGRALQQGLLREGSDRAQ